MTTSPKYKLVVTSRKLYLSFLELITEVIAITSVLTATLGCCVKNATTMLYRFFAKESHPNLEEAMQAFITHLTLNPKQWIIKQQIGTYNRAYSYVAQGDGLTISFYKPALKKAVRKGKTEIMVACENAPWFSLLAHRSRQTDVSKHRLDVKTLAPNSAWEPWELQTNNPTLAEHLLTKVEAQLGVFKTLEAVEWDLERQRLYVQWPWLPDTPARQEQLKATMDFALVLTQALDQVTIAVSG